MAEGNEVAWGYGEKKSEEEIKNVGGKNRMICYPCTYSFPLFSLARLHHPQSPGCVVADTIFF